ncbi:hypothetical protein [Kribbella sp. NPDC049584]|uniref:hypothetical protein n=1 Tax=Kribbella sp. NPDC049584 TaxID=3154833 RepID=UPI003447739A
MNYTEALEALQKSVDDTVDEIRQAAVEDHEHLAARIDNQKSASRQRLDDVNGKLDSKWDQVKADASAKMADLKANMAQRRKVRDAEVAESDADWAEADAASAIDLAVWATDNARDSILDAIDARNHADDLTKLAAQHR